MLGLRGTRNRRREAGSGWVAQKFVIPTPASHRACRWILQPEPPTCHLCSRCGPIAPGPVPQHSVLASAFLRPEGHRGARDTKPICRAPVTFARPTALPYKRGEAFTAAPWPKSRACRLLSRLLKYSARCLSAPGEPKALERLQLKGRAWCCCFGKEVFSLFVLNLLVWYQGPASIS